MSKASAVILLDGTGVVLARDPAGQGLAGESVADFPLCKIVLAQGTGFVKTTGLDGVPRLFGFVPITETGSGPYLIVGIQERSLSPRLTPS